MGVFSAATVAAAAVDGQEWHGSFDTAGGPGVAGWLDIMNTGIALHIPSAAALVGGYTPTVTSSTAVTLVYTSSGIQSFSGSTAQQVNLPTTSVTSGMAWLIVNNSSATITVKASGGATVGTVAAGAIGVFVAATNTPTTAAGWNTYFQKTLVNAIFTGYNETGQPLGTIGSTITMGALVNGTMYTGTLTASTASAITLPTVGAGQSGVLGLTQCASGTGGTATFAAASGQTLKWVGGAAPTITATNGKTDHITIWSYDGSTVYANIAQNS